MSVIYKSVYIKIANNKNDCTPYKLIEAQTDMSITEYKEHLESLIERDIPKNPDIKFHFGSSGDPVFESINCPNCNYRKLFGWEKYCPECGQAIHGYKDVIIHEL